MTTETTLTVADARAIVEAIWNNKTRKLKTKCPKDPRAAYVWSQLRPRLDPYCRGVFSAMMHSWDIEECDRAILDQIVAIIWRKVGG